MIKSVFINNYRNFKKQTIQFKPLTVLSGCNLSGKTSLTDALRQLKFAPTDPDLSNTTKIKIQFSEFEATWKYYIRPDTTAITWQNKVLESWIPNFDLDYQCKNWLTYIFSDQVETWEELVGYKTATVKRVESLVHTILSLPSNSLLMLDNIEAGLHGVQQERLIELLLLAVNSGIQIVLETHSDHIYNSIRVAVKSNYISSTDVIFNHFNKFTVTPVTVNESGRINNSPSQFFDTWDVMLEKLLDDEISF